MTDNGAFITRKPITQAIPGALRILLIEDDHDISDMLALFFTWRGYSFYHAGDGEEGLQLASRVLPHAILMDISLPDTDGYALTVRLRWRPRTAHIPILFVSKWGSRPQRLMGLALGADDYLTKPFDLQELLLRVQNIIARAARDQMTDLRTGLPAVFTVRDWLEHARADPERAIIEVMLEHAIPFRNVYGSQPGAQVQQDLGQLLLCTVNRQGDSEDFIGYLDEDQYVIVTRQSNAQAIAEQLVAVFNSRVGQYYTEADRQRGSLDDHGTSCPLMRLFCRITNGTRQSEVT